MLHLKHLNHHLSICFFNLHDCSFNISKLPIYKSIHLKLSCKNVLFWRISENSQAKNLCWRLFLNKVLGCRLWTLWKRSSPQVFFIWILGYFSQRLFNKTFLSGSSFSIILKLVLTSEIKTCCIITLYRQKK